MIIDRRSHWLAYTVHFAYDSAAVKKSEKANVQAVADALRRDPSTKLQIEGNCDERGTEEYNRSLGERRALAVRQALAKLGLIRRASLPSAMARTSRWTPAITKRPGRKTAATISSCSTPRAGPEDRVNLKLSNGRGVRGHCFWRFTIGGSGRRLGKARQNL